MDTETKVSIETYDIADIEADGDGVIVKLKKNLKDYHDIDYFQELILELIYTGSTKITIDFGAVEFVDEEIISRFLVICKRLSRHEGVLYLKNLCKEIEELLAPLCTLNLLKLK